MCINVANALGMGQRHRTRSRAEIEAKSSSTTFVVGEHRIGNRLCPQYGQYNRRSETCPAPGRDHLGSYQVAQR